MRRLAAGLALLGALGCRTEPPPRDPVQPAGPGIAPAEPRAAARDARALLIGVDTYADPSLSPLPGAATDVQTMRDLLVDSFGFPASGVRTLVGAQATGTAIVEAFHSHLIEPAGPGTVVVFHFSGHGRRVYDQSGDEPDEWDEAIVPYDATARTGDVLDDTFAPLVDALVAKGASATLIFDSCFAGSPVRGGAAVRAAPPVAPATRGADRPATDGRGDLLDDRRGLVVITATTNDQKAHELRDPSTGTSHGALTWALARAARTSAPGTTWRTLIGTVRSTVRTYLPAQSPTARGAHVDRVLFGLDDRAPPDGSLPVRRVDGALELGGGTLHGVEVGDRWALLLGGADARAADRPVADVISVTGTRARLAEPQAVSMLTTLSPSVRSVRLSRGLNATPLTISVHGGEPVPLIESLLRKAGHRVGPGGTLRIDVGADEARLSAPDGTPMGVPVGLGEDGSAVDLVGEVRRWLRWRRLLALDGGAEAQVSLTIDGAADGRAAPGDTLRIRIDNAGGLRWYAHLFLLSDDGRIASLWPDAHADAGIEGGVTVFAPSGGRTLTARLPDGRDRVVDTLKLVLTTTRADFSAVASRGEAATSGAPLVDWLLVTGQRGDDPPSAVVTDWAVRTARLEICRPGACDP